MLTNVSLRRVYAFNLIVSLLLACVVVLSLFCGSSNLNINTLVHNLDDGFSRLVFLQIRLPRTLLALLTGVLLSSSGVVFQMYFRNPLAEPGIMGICSGATLGAVTASCFFPYFTFKIISTLNIGAFCGALFAGLLIVVLCSGKHKASSTVVVLLCGTALGTFYSALTSILLSLKSEKLKSMYIWMMGSFNGRTWDDFLFVLLPAIMSFMFLFMCRRKLDLLSGGESAALGMGVNVKRLRLQVVLCGAFASCAACCAGGTIGFIGLIAPHIARRFTGPGQKNLLPGSMLLGALLTTASDLIARTAVRPGELPVGVITSLIGAPFFISLLFSGRGFKNE